MDSLDSLLSKFLDNPYPLWNSSLVNPLVANKKTEIAQNYLTLREYSTSGIWTGLEGADEKIECLLGETYLEYPSRYLNEFYRNNDLDLLSVNQYDEIDVVAQIKSALNQLFDVPGCGKTVSQLVHMIQVLRQPAPEYDVSYSHPKIPFTIFVSVGKKNSDLDGLRLAESILHEAMHLQLSLVEEHIPLIIDNTQVYYSPWREEMRPLRGVLHAIFVFRAIQQWYLHLQDGSYAFEITDFASWRIENIQKDFSMIKEFYRVAGLTSAGAVLSEKLL